MALFLTTAGLVLVFILPMIVWFFKRPSNHRDWSPDQAILSYADIAGQSVKIHNIRNFQYRSEHDYNTEYYDKDFDLNKIKSLEYVIDPFSKKIGAAHTFLTFGFENDGHVAISIEIRKKKGDSFSPWRGLFRSFEIMYVIADERDVIKLRTNFRKDEVYLFPVKASPQEIRALFLDILKRVNQLKEKPEFYNTVLNSCAVNVVAHVNRVTKRKIPWSFKIFFPAYSDRFIYDLGLIDTHLSFEEARKKYYVSKRGQNCGDDEDFSKKIRT